MTFHYHESADVPIRVIPTDQSAVDCESEAGIAACNAYRATLDESLLILQGKPLVFLFREPTGTRYDKARRDSGCKGGAAFDQCTARELIRHCLVGWENGDPSWPDWKTLAKIEGTELVVSSDFTDQMPPSYVTQCGLSLWRHFILGVQAAQKGKGEIQVEPDSGN
jgi:hypothetical protein